MPTLSGAAPGDMDLEQRMRAYESRTMTFTNLQELRGVACGSPCVVKNTFLHVVGEGQQDAYGNSSARRQRSEPAKLRHREPEAERAPRLAAEHPWPCGPQAGRWPAEEDVSDSYEHVESLSATGEDSEVDEDAAMNSVDLAVRSGKDYAGPFGCPFSDTSTRQSTTQSSGQETSFTGDFDRDAGSPSLSLAEQARRFPLPVLAPAGEGAADHALADTGSTPDPESLARPRPQGRLGSEAEPGTGGQAATACGASPAGAAVGTQDSISGQYSDESPQSKAANRERKRRARMDPMSWDEGVVTVMVRQIPRQFTQLMFLKEVNRRGFEGLFNFLYLPFDLKKGINVGYGFLGFIEPRHAQALRAELDGTYLDKHMRMKGKPLRIHPAKVQGYEANFQHFVQTKTGQKQDPQFSPLFFPPGTSLGQQSSGTSSTPPQDASWAAGSQQTNVGLASNSGYMHWCMAQEQQQQPQQPQPQQQQQAAPQQWQAEAEAQPQQWRGEASPSRALPNWCLSESLGVGGPAEEPSSAAQPRRQQPPQWLPQQRPQQGQQPSYCPACGHSHHADHNFCARCGSRVSNRMLSSRLPVAGVLPRTPDDSAKLFQDLELERHRLSKELADAQAEGQRRASAGHNQAQLQGQQGRQQAQARPGGLAGCTFYEQPEDALPLSL